jgi:hypothetical protein
MCFGNKVDVYVGIITFKGLRTVGQSLLLTRTGGATTMHCLIDIMCFNVFLFEPIHTLTRMILSSENVKLLQCVVSTHHPVNCFNPWRASRT